MLDLKNYEECKLSNGNTLYYTKHNGTSYEIAIKLADGTIEEYSHIVDKHLVDIISNCISHRNRVRIWYGNIKTGETWLEEYDVTGVIGRSMGDRFKIPILVNNARSYGGGAILTNCIVRIDDIKTKAVLWKVDNFHTPDFNIRQLDGVTDSKGELKERWGVEVKKDGKDWELDAILNSEIQAQRWVDFMTGKRYSK